MPRKSVPEGWQKYTPLGMCVEGTKLVAFKVPLKLEVCKNKLEENEWLTPAILRERLPNLKAVIDLTNTDRYYSPKEFTDEGIDHVKILVPGGGEIPPDSKLREFFAAVDDFMKKFADNPDALMGVHCTHGINRTGYFICSYLVDSLKIHPDDAITRFQTARGHKIERAPYLKRLLRLDPEKTRFGIQKGNNEHTSPMGNVYEDENYRDHYRGRNSHQRFRDSGQSSYSRSRDHRNADSGEGDNYRSRQDRNKDYRNDRDKGRSESSGISSRNSRERNNRDNWRSECNRNNND